MYTQQHFVAANTESDGDANPLFILPSVAFAGILVVLLASDRPTPLALVVGLCFGIVLSVLQFRRYNQ